MGQPEAEPDKHEVKRFTFAKQEEKEQSSSHEDESQSSEEEKTEEFLYPFLTTSPDNLIQHSNSNQYWGPLYKRLICINEPRLLFVDNHVRSPMRYLILERQCQAV